LPNCVFMVTEEVPMKGWGRGDNGPPTVRAR